MVGLSDDNLILGAYKEPLKEVKKGFGYYGAISITKDGMGIQCHECGKLYSNLSFHIHKTHKYTVNEYRKKFQLSPATRLVSENFRNEAIKRVLKMQERLKEEGLYDKHISKLLKGAAKYRTKAIKDGTYNKNMSLTLEDKNLRGICPDQLLETIHAAARHYKKTPTISEYEDFHGTGRFRKPIEKTFGTWVKALAKAGYTPRKGWNYTGRSKPYDRDELIEILQTFREEHGRVPRPSDFNRGFLPAQETFTKYFGTMMEARKQAGILDEWLEVKNKRTGNIYVRGSRRDSLKAMKV